MFMYKQRDNDLIVDRRNINTRAQDALLFTTQRPLNEKYKINTYYNGALGWNELQTIYKNVLEYNTFK